MDRCGSCGKPLTVSSRYEQSNWCKACVRHELADQQRREDENDD